MFKMKKIVIAMIGFLLMANEASAVSIYDGIYQLNPNIGYATLREQNGTMIAVVNQTYGGYSWGAANGTMNGSSVQLSTIIGHINETINVNFTSATTFTAIIVSCSPNTAGYYCSFKAGQTLTGTKIW